MQTIIIIGKVEGDYHNVDVSKKFEGEMLVIVRPNGNVIVQNINQGIRPICYIGGGAETSMSRNLVDAEIEVIASTDDGQYLSLRFTEVRGLCGVPEKQDIDSMALSIMQAVADMNGRYGRVRIARLLTGSTSRCVLTMDMTEIRNYGVARGLSQKEIIAIVDWLIDEEYLSMDKDEMYPVLSITGKGDETLEDFEMDANIRLGNINNAGDVNDISMRFDKLREWRKRMSHQADIPLYIVLQNKTIEDLVIQNPKTLKDLENIYGMGNKKIKAFGQEILDVLKAEA